MCGTGGTQGVEVRPARLGLLDPLAGELARLNLLQDLLHLLLGGRGDHARPAGDVAVLGGVRDAVAHPRDALFVHQVHDELHLVEALEVGHLGLVAGLDQGLEPGLDQRGEAAAQHDLLTEQVGLGLLGEGGLDDARACATDGLGVRERQVLGRAGGILLDRDEARHSPALGVGAAHQVPGALGGDHDHVDSLGRTDALEADVESVGERERLALLHVALDVGRVGGLLLGVGHGHHDDVGPLGRIRDALDRESGRLGLGRRRRPLAQAHHDRHTALLQVQRMGVPLGAVADDGHLASADDRGIHVLLVVHLCCHQLAFPLTARLRASRSNLGSATRPVRWLSTMP